MLAQLPDLLTQSADATFEFVNDAPVIVPGTPGTTLDPAALAASVVAAAVAERPHRHASSWSRRTRRSRPPSSRRSGVKEIVSEFSTPLNSEPRRTVNITNGASKISGTLIRPGRDVQPDGGARARSTRRTGTSQAGAIVNGEHTDAWGGGLSQISTTTYNAAFLAGFEDVEHRPHSEWFSRYPEGREATIFTGTLDMRWKNNTPYGALVQAWVADGRVYVRIWGTKYWTVESDDERALGRGLADDRVLAVADVRAAVGAGNPGFTVTVTRRTYLERRAREDRVEHVALQAAEQDRLRAAARPATPPRRRTLRRRPVAAGTGGAGGTSLASTMSAAGTCTSPCRVRTSTPSSSTASSVAEHVGVPGTCSAGWRVRGAGRSSRSRRTTTRTPGDQVRHGRGGSRGASRPWTARRGHCACERY